MIWIEVGERVAIHGVAGLGDNRVARGVRVVGSSSVAKNVIVSQLGIESRVRGSERGQEMAARLNTRMPVRIVSREGH